jgi:hypothetical protein
VEEIGVPGENHQPAASHWQTSHNVVFMYTSPKWSGIGKLFDTMSHCMKNTCKWPFERIFKLICYYLWLVLKQTKLICFLLFSIILGSSGIGKFFDTMNRQFSEEEWKVIKSPTTDTEQLKLFFRHWVCKYFFYIHHMAILFF